MPTPIIPNPIVSGLRQRLVRTLIWLNILLIALKYSRGPLAAIRHTRQLLQLRDRFRNGHKGRKYARAGSRYFFTYNAPGWPSLAFSRYIKHRLMDNDPRHDGRTSIHTLILAITKKCGFNCEHCCEWENLNKPERLSREDLVKITHRFQDMGISQLQLSGGEPLLRYRDIIFLLDRLRPGTDCWILSSGYNLTMEKAKELKSHGLTGITISLDHTTEIGHDTFRGVKGSFRAAIRAIAFARRAGLAVCCSICPANAFILEDNLLRYAELTRTAGAAFIQILEPKAVGRYTGLPVQPGPSTIGILERFYERLNYLDPAFIRHPILTYHGYYSRRIGCAGSGKDYVYVDTDGDVHSCPFCRHKHFSALDEGLETRIQQLRRQGCGVFQPCVSKQKKTENANL